MFDELKKFAMKKVMKRTAISVGILVLILIAFGSSFLKLVQGPVNLDSLSKDELLGSYVEAEVYAIVDAFASYSQEDDSGRKTNQRNYYIIPVGEEEYIALEVGSSDFSMANRISDETYEYIMGIRDDLSTTMHVKGTIRKMDGEISSYYYEWFEETGFIDYSSSDELKTIALNYVLDPDYMGGFEEFLVYTALLAGGYLLLYIIIILIKGFTGAYLISVKAFVRKNQSTISIEEVEREYHNAQSIESVKVSKDYTFYFKGPKSFIVKNDDIIWAYLRSTTHRTNGIKTHVTKSLILNTRNKKTHTINMRSEEAVTSVLKLYSMNNPSIVLGYSDELMKCYRKDMDAFLSMGLGRRQSTVSSDRQNGVARVILRNSGENSIHVIKAIREYLGCGLKEAKDLVDNTPSTIKDNILLKDAQAIKAELESLGATVEINMAS